MVGRTCYSFQTSNLVIVAVSFFLEDDSHDTIVYNSGDGGDGGDGDGDDSCYDSDSDGDGDLNLFSCRMTVTIQLSITHTTR